MQKHHSIATAPAQVVPPKINFSKIDTILSYLTFGRLRNPKKTIAVIKLAGVIGSNGAFKTGINLDGYNQIIEEAFELPKLEAICLLVNSPGGSPVQSELIASRIRQLADKKQVKVFSFIEDIGASGGYWLACAGDEIYASISSIIGSIGVVSSGFGFTEAIKKLGIERRIYTQGKNKSILDPFKPEDADSVALIKRMQKDVHGHFISYVKQRRGNKITQEDDIIYNAEVWSGLTALDFGLIDGIQNMHQFIEQKFGDNIDIKFMNEKKSWIKKKLGIENINNNLAENMIKETINHIEEKIYFSKFGL